MEFAENVMEKGLLRFGNDIGENETYYIDKVIYPFAEDVVADCVAKAIYIAFNRLVEDGKTYSYGADGIPTGYRLDTVDVERFVKTLKLEANAVDIGEMDITDAVTGFMHYARTMLEALGIEDFTRYTTAVDRCIFDKAKALEVLTYGEKESLEGK